MLQVQIILSVSRLMSFQVVDIVYVMATVWLCIDYNYVTENGWQERSNGRNESQSYARWSGVEQVVFQSRGGKVIMFSTYYQNEYV